MGIPFRRLFVAMLLCLPSVPGLRAGDDIVTLKDGSSLSGLVVELGGNRIELVQKSGSRKLLKRDISKVTFDEGRLKKTVEATDVVVKTNGHRICGKVELLDGGQKVQVTLPGGGKVLFQRQDVARIVKSGEATEEDATVYTAELSKAAHDALERLKTAKDAGSEEERFLASSGILVLGPIREALAKAAPDAPGTKVLLRLERLNRLKEVVPTEIEENEPRVYEILSSGSAQDKCGLLMFAFPRYVEESVAVAEHLAADAGEDPVVRAWSIDFLRRMQKNRELVRIYRRTSGQTQLSSAIALGQNRILIGVPALIEALEFDSLEMRSLASKHLRELTGEDLQFRPDGAPQARKEAVARWRAWWQKNEKPFTSVAQNVLRAGTGEDAVLDGSPTAERLDAVKLWTEAGTAVDAKRYSDAAALLRKALDRDGTFFQAHIALSVVLYANLGKPGEAATLLQGLKTKRLPGVTSEDRQWIFLHLGNCLRLTGDLDGAAAAYADARSLAPDNLQAALGMVETAFQQATAGENLKPEERRKKLDVALEAARAATQVIDKASEDLITVRSDNLPLAGEVPFDRREYNKSILGLRRKYRFEKKDLSFKVAKILALRGDKKEAVLTLRGGVEDVLLEVDDASKKLEADMRCYLGLLYEEMGQSLLALREFRRVLKDFQPDHVEAQRGVERLRKQAGDRASN